jgi:hypothetical protein
MLTEPQLIYIPQNQPAMLNNMLRINMLHRIVRSVNIRVAIFKRRFEHKRCRESIPRGRSVVRARIATLALDVGDVGVLLLR